MGKFFWKIKDLSVKYPWILKYKKEYIASKKYGILYNYRTTVWIGDDECFVTSNPKREGEYVYDRFKKEWVFKQRDAIIFLDIYTGEVVDTADDMDEFDRKVSDIWNEGYHIQREIKTYPAIVMILAGLLEYFFLIFLYFIGPGISIIGLYFAIIERMPGALILPGFYILVILVGNLLPVILERLGIR